MLRRLPERGFAECIGFPKRTWGTHPLSASAFPLRGAGLSCCASSPAPSSWVSPLAGLHPSRNTVWPAAPAALPKAARPVAGERGCADGRRAARDRHLLRALAWRTGGLSLPALRFALPPVAPPGQTATPTTRHARSRAARIPIPIPTRSQLGPARPARQSLRLVARRTRGRRPSCPWAGRSRQPSRLLRRHAVCWCSGPRVLRSLGGTPVQPTALPPRRPHPWLRGTCGGIFNAAGP